MAQIDATGELRILLFGPQVPHWSQENLIELQSMLLRNAHLQFIIKTLVQLPSLWPSLVQTCGISGICGEEKFKELEGFAAGKTIPDSKNLGNILSAPLTVVSHIAEFMQLSHDSRTNESLADFQAAQGFCIGFLSAAALSSSSDWTGFQRHASNALRLAACIGAVIDSLDASHAPPDRATAVSVRWNTPSERAYLETSLDLFPEAYVSCISDDCTLTITLPDSDQTSFCARLCKVKIPTISIGLQGSYHHINNAGAAESLKKLCAGNEELELPDAHKLHLPLRSTANTDTITTGFLHEVAIDLILCKRAHWFQTVQQTVASLASRKVKIIPVGKACIPSSLKLGFTGGVSHQINEHDTLSRTEEVAVVGMACRFPEADSIEEFWQRIRAGETSISELPTKRFNPGDIRREPKLGSYWGNFIRRPDVFDHRFFGISGREAKSMDPQQRLALQVAYEAYESSGYCSLPKAQKETDVGCYLGVGAVDYEQNVASEDANAFSATGTLRAFISGRISHFFGWSGPSITFDTACSSSAVAIHTACKALLAGECKMAMAGGVNVIAGPDLYQNLSAASFLNPNGCSRAFDASAGGYCRGEGAGILILKPFSKALADSDTILGVISGSAVNQGSSCSPITVPDSQSQASLYKKALSFAHIDPMEVNYVEAHGTGTLVGDPIEYESVRLALTGPRRNEILFLGSVKDNIGHTEAASGVAGVIKTLLMMQNRTIPKQANFACLNPSIHASPADKMEIPKATKPWSARRFVALVNNYGAAGSNAAIVLRGGSQTSSSPIEMVPGVRDLLSSAVWPIFLSAKSADNLQSNINALKWYSSDVQTSIMDISYSIARRQNPSFEHRTAFTVGDKENLIFNLSRLATTANGAALRTEKTPVVLCFGGQIGSSVIIGSELYGACDLLRKNINECDAICQALGLSSIFPHIVKGEAIKDIVTLHCMLLSMQVSFARCWLDCGLEVNTLIGHSFGQISALCIAGSISLEDAFRLISSRARLIRDSWGPECGIMISVECDREEVKGVVNLVNATPGLRVDIACYNGPRSFVLAGDTKSMERVEEECKSFKATRLQNTHAYHSYLADGILHELKGVAESVSVRPPRIHIETCSAEGAWSKFDAENLVQHTRQPVHFEDAVERIAARLPSAVWLEAGSASPIIPMTRRILRKPGRSDTFIPMDLGSTEAMGNLASVACQLWNAGCEVQYWLFHRISCHLYTNVNPPPYQFAQTRHWIEYKPHSERSPAVFAPDLASKELNLVNLVENRSSEGEHLFWIDTANVVFDLAGRGHAVAGYSLCPASMYIELAARCVMAIPDSTSKAGSLPHIESLAMSSPLGLGGDSKVLMRISKSSQDAWDFTLFSHPSMHNMENGGTVHASGRISFDPMTDFTESRLQLLKKFARISRTDRILKSPLATGISGPIVYELFSHVVDYADYYRGVKSLSALENEAVGFVTVPANRPFGLDPMVCDPISLDNFLQVAGIHVNCLSPRKHGEVFMCTDVEEVIFSASFMTDISNSRTWTVSSRYELISKVNVINDIFIYDASSKDLVVAIMGATFRSVPFKFLAKTLAKLNLTRLEPASNSFGDSIHSSSEHAEDSGYHTSVYTPPFEDHNKEPATVDFSMDRSVRPQVKQPTEDPNESDVLVQLVCQMFSSIMEIPVEEIQPLSLLLDIGIDSLLITEVLAEIHKRFNVNITQAQFQECTDVVSLSRLIQPHQAFENGHNNFTEGFPDSPQRSCEDDVGYEESASANLAVVCQSRFGQIKDSYDGLAKMTGFENFCTDVFPLQSQLVVQYVLEAFTSLGCSLTALECGDDIPSIQYDPRHTKLVLQLYNILEHAGLVKKGDGGKFRRTAAPILRVPAITLHSEMLVRFPNHASETKLLYTTASRLASCLSGTVDPLALLFRDPEARALLENVYMNAPMFKTGSMLLTQYLSSVLEHFQPGREIRILELGAGTGGTTQPLIEHLTGLSTKPKFSYTFTDLSSSLVTAARRRFGKWPFMEFTVLDIEKNPEPQFAGAYDIIISTNCIHATKDLIRSTTNISKMLRADGVLCLVELTQNLFWFDLVFGLLEGWWLSTDGREHALVDEQRWKISLNAAGFHWVDWSQTASAESHILKVITASPSLKTSGAVGSDNHLETQQTMVYKNVNGLDLHADLYYPSKAVDRCRSLPVALMIHGGGHIMLSRNDIRPEQTQMLLDRGFLPVSIDYRLCPETTLLEGPMADVVDALAWIRTALPHLTLARKDVRIDGEKVVSVGWSTGGQLAMSLAWTSFSRGIRPPEAILAFYCPTDYEDPFWTKPNMPIGAKDTTPGSDTAPPYQLDKNIWAAVCDDPITSYNVPRTKLALGGWLAPSDSRSRLALYMNWHGRTLHVLLNGLDKATQKEPLPPRPADITAVSPLAHIHSGAYSSPTFIIHPREDDLIPWQQAQRTWEAMRAQKIEAELRIVDGVPHLFDVYPKHQHNKVVMKYVAEGYEFLRKHVGML